MSENIRGVGFRKLVKKNAKNRFFNSNFWMVFKNIVKKYKKTIVPVKFFLKIKVCYWCNVEDSILFYKFMESSTF
jgi:hypothetical protein